MVSNSVVSRQDYVSSSQVTIESSCTSLLKQACTSTKSLPLSLRVQHSSSETFSVLITSGTVMSNTAFDSGLRYSVYVVVFLTQQVFIILHISSS